MDRHTTVSTQRFLQDLLKEPLIFCKPKTRKMQENEREPTGRANKSSKDYYDLTEEASKRPGGEEATIAARQAESDDIHAETTSSRVDSTEGGQLGRK